jgi:hypothetical protein
MQAPVRTPMEIERHWGKGSARKPWGNIRLWAPQDPARHTMSLLELTRLAPGGIAVPVRRKSVPRPVSASLSDEPLDTGATTPEATTSDREAPTPIATPRPGTPTPS